MKGTGEDEAVLCNQSRTYGLKAVFTTNMMLLVPPPSQSGSDVSEPASDTANTAVVRC